MAKRKVVRRKATKTKAASPTSATPEPGQMVPVEVKPGYTPEDVSVAVTFGKYQGASNGWILTIESNGAGVRVLDIHFTHEEMSRLIGAERVEADARIFTANSELWATEKVRAEPVDVPIKPSQWGDRYEVVEAWLSENLDGEGWVGGGVQLNADKIPVIVKTTGQVQVYPVRYLKEQQ